MVKNLPACWRPRFNPWVGKIPWGRKWQPTPVFLPGESHGGRSLVGYSPWGRKELVTTERLTHTHTLLLRTLHHPLCAPWMLCLVAQSCLTLWTVWPMDPLSSSVQMDSPGKNTGVGCHALLQRIFWTQGSNPGLPHCQQILYDLSYQGSLLTLYTSF